MDSVILLVPLEYSVILTSTFYDIKLISSDMACRHVARLRSFISSVILEEMLLEYFIRETF